MNDFVHLHVHTEYSLLDGASRLDELTDRIAMLGQKAVAITDHGCMYGVAEFYKKAVAKGIKPIIGCEVYVAPRSRLMKDHNIDAKYSHLILLAKNNIGYHNLLKIVSDSFINGYYYKPRTDKETLQKYSEGLIALSGCIAGSVQRMILNGDMDGAKAEALQFKNIFGDDFYLEIQDHFLEEDRKILSGLSVLSKELSIPMAATNDTHYNVKEDAYIQKVLMCISMNKSIYEDNPLAFQTEEFYIKSTEEMAELFLKFPEAIENTVKIADKCNVILDFENMHLPKFDLPHETDRFEYLKNLCYEGLQYHYGNLDNSKRLDYELSVIKDMKFVDYFLIVSDFVNYAKRNGIAVGPGRGSATGSIVSYCLGITDIDPIKYDLIFERFLNPSRASMPDIDIDFCVERRQEVIDYIVKKYGEQSVAQIITFGTLAAKAAIKDVGRVLEIPYSVTESVSKHFSSKPGTTIKSTLESDADLKNRYRNNSDIKKLIDTAMCVEGMPRHGSTHAAGVVITDGPVSDYIPLSRNDETIVTQYQKTEVEQLGLLKIDLLGLRNITVIDKTVKLIKQTNSGFDIEKIPQNDFKTFKMIGAGNTFGVFQLESGGMRNLLIDLSPNSIDDIITAVSLYRPGPMDSIPLYLKNRKSPEKIKYKTEKLKPILESTFGCIVYQEQVMQIAREVAGYTYGHADVLRAAMSKKKYDIMENERALFINGAVSNGVSKSIAKSIFDDMSDFAKYGFNKSHAAGYAVIAYRTAYLKANYPTLFMASLLTSVTYNTAKIKEYISECHRIGIKVFSPDVNKSANDFYADEKGIYYSLCAVKNVGQKFASAIYNERIENGEYKDFIDFVMRIPNEELNKRAVESLVKCGAFDCFGYSRRQMLTVFDKILGDVILIKKQSFDNQLSFFNTVDSADTKFSYFDNAMPEFEKSRLLAYEKESLGLYLSEHPAGRFKLLYDNGTYNIISELNNSNDEKIRILGIIESVRIVTTKQMRDMAYVTVEDISGFIEVILFPQQFSKYKTQIDEGTAVEISGHISEKDSDTNQIICERIDFPNIDRMLEKFKKIYISFPSEQSQLFKYTLKLLYEFPGENVCVFRFEDTGKAVAPKGKLKVSLDGSLINQLKNLLGQEKIIIK